MNSINQKKNSQTDVKVDEIFGKIYTCLHFLTEDSALSKDRLCKVAQLCTPNSGRGPQMNFRGQIGDFHKGEA